VLNMKQSKLAQACVGVTALFGLSQIAAAQQPLRLDEIVVTAQKRSESINDIGLTVQAMSGDELSAQGINSVKDLVKVVPGLSYANSYYNTPVYTLRGVGFYENSLAAYPAVSVYVDEIPLVFPVFSSQAAIDVERVEVLKGPQGTLFGQNATGGTINYIAAKPTDEFALGTDLSVNEYGQVDGSGFVNGPLSDTLNARLAVKAAQGGEWQKSITHGGELGDQDLFAARLLLDWTPTDRLNVIFNLNGSVDKSDPQAGQYFNLLPQVPGAINPGLTNAPKPGKDNREADWSEANPPRGDDSQYQTALRVTYDLNDDVTMTSITSYIDFERDQYNDGDGVNGDSLEFRMQGELSSFVQELRFANSDDNELRWIVGGNYEESSSEEFANQYAGLSTVVSNLGFPEHTNDMFLDTDITSYAVFANGDWDATDRLTLKAGVRYTETEREAKTCTLDTGNGFLFGFFGGVSQAVTGSPTPPVFNDDCITLDPVTFQPGLFEDTLDEDNVSWRIGADYSLTEDVLLYANVAKGYKAGSYLFTNASSAEQFEPVVQESVISYEAGFKASVLDGGMQLNGAVFYYDYKNKQMRGKLNDAVFGVLDALVNVPESEIQGAELSMAYLPIENLTLSMAATYVDSEITEYTGVAFNGGIEDFTGSSIPFSPDLSFSAAAEYSFEVSQNWEGFVGGNLNYNDDTYAVIGDVEDALIESYTVLDLRFGVRSYDERYAVTVFGQNVTDEWYYVNAPVLYDTQVRYTGRPVTWGLRFSYRM